MNGPEHYALAEELAGPKGAWYYAPSDEVPAILARAQVHATLAHAAAIAMASIDRMPEEDFVEWDKVAGIPTRSGDES